ncbi:MAG: Gfo/Idh/MocA family oxidoreductase [Lachnospiraceae bacterium]|nr:Gfo/Idh/MocA family oxidoreductase [Lachnospiraceae bacterium]
MKKVGIIGCGGIAQVHAWVLSSLEDVKLTLFCDIEPVRARELANKYAKDAEICADWRSVCDADVDVVHICTPHMLHAPMAVGLLRSGKAVFSEKPCAVSLQQFEEMKREAALHPGKLGFCFQNRYNGTTQKLDSLVSEDRVGRIVGGRAFVTWRRDEDYYSCSLWKGRKETEGGGVLINQAIHTLDLLLRYLGEADVVKSSMAHHHLPAEKVEVEDTVEAWMSFPEGKRACFYASNAYAKDAPVILELQGECGRICMNGQEVSLYPDDGPPEHFLCEKELGIGKDYWGCGHRACITDFYRCLMTGERYGNDPGGVENTFRTMMRIYEEAEKNGGEG